MVDTVDRATRSRMMARVHGKDTQPELIVRRGLHRRGFRFRLHNRQLPGRPDMTLRRYATVVEIHGCFWHGHADCPYFRLRDSSPDFWKNKIEANRQRDAKNLAALRDTGWRTLVVWECALRDRQPDYIEAVLDQAARFITGRDDRSHLDIRGPVSE